MMEKGVQVYYITGNHDEFLRKFTPAGIGNLRIINQVILELDGAKTWIFHGDVFDHVIHRVKWLAKFASASYGLLTLINKLINSLLKLAGKHEIVIYTSIKKRLVKEKHKPNKFERLIAKTATDQGYRYVICGHSHIPRQKEIGSNSHPIQYFNSGDWVGNFTAVEYYNKKWQLYYHEEPDADDATDEIEIPEQKQIYSSLIKELALNSIL
jgi:UDP-2,3-diacylglucosamine pyrophosphatase LpxH